MSPTRRHICEWLSTIDVKGKTLDIGGNIWSVRDRVRSFAGEYETLDENDWDLNYPWGSIGNFDNIFCVEITQFVWDPYNLLLNLRDLLAPKGRLFITFHLKHPPMRGHDYLRYTLKGASKLLDLAGFGIKRLEEPTEGFYLIEAYKL